MNNGSPESHRVRIIADDLTSAADGASPFLRRGFTPRINRRRLNDDKAVVLSVDTGSRNMTEAAAVDVARQATSALAGRWCLYKTLDSTLRGHARAEIAAAFRESRRDRLLIAPAFPAAGRTTIGGIQLLDGRPVSETLYGTDPVHPARTSRILDLIDPFAGHAVVIPIGMDAAQCRAAVAGARVVILDANSQQGLNRRVAELTASGSWLWVGSPGLSQALAASVRGAPADMSKGLPLARRVLVVVGSGNQVSQEQCAGLADGGIPVYFRASEIAQDPLIACLRVPAVRKADARAVLCDLIGEAETALAHHDFGAVVVTGGETLDALLQRLSIHSFVLFGELEEGFPVGHTEPEIGRPPLILAMKAGGFGEPGALLKGALRLVSTQSKPGAALP